MADRKPWQNQHTETQLMQWTKDAEIFAEEVLDPEDFQKLMQSKHKSEALKEVATAGMSVYKSAMNQVPLMMDRGLDEFAAKEVARDQSQEAMRAVLAEQMEKVIPGFRSLYE